jgi:plastocyanin
MKAFDRAKTAAALGLAGAVMLGVAGCGGKEMGSDEAVVTTEPGVSVATAPGAAPAATASSTPAATPSAAPSGAAPSSAPTKAEGWGTLKGQITFNGTPPAPKELVEQGKAPKDPTVCAKDAPIPSERLVVDGATKGVKNVLVYIPKPTAVNEEAKSAASTAKVEFDQKNCTFIPHVVAVMVGATVDLKNSDPANHNINSRLKQNSFNSLLSGGQGVERKVDAAERTPGELTCDIHPWMKGYWMVLDNPYFAVTDDKGNFEIKNVPAGSQKVVVWQEAVGFVTASAGNPVTVKANDTATMDLKIEASKVRPE